MRLPWLAFGVSLFLADAVVGADGAVAKAVLEKLPVGENLLKADRWRAFDKGFEQRDGEMICVNGDDANAIRGASQAVVLNQASPDPIVATVQSRADGVTGGRDSDYSLYLDLVYDNGAHLWGQSATFATGTHDWQSARVVVFPERPVKSLTAYLLFRRHGGRAAFREPTLRIAKASDGAVIFDGVPVVAKKPARMGFQVRDVAAGGDYLRLDKAAAELTLETKQTEQNGATLVDVVLRDTRGKDRAVSLVYTLPFASEGTRWLVDPRRDISTVVGREYMHATPMPAVGGGRLSRYPFAAVAAAGKGQGLGIDMAAPAVFRTGYHAGTRELFVAWDLGLTPERPEAKVRLVHFPFDGTGGFREALAKYYTAFPDAFTRRVARQGQWMPFAKISKLKDPADFGIRFKEGHDETAWDDAHDILTFRYTEPMTWWMPMAKDLPRTPTAALAEAKRLADRGSAAARALTTSGFHDANGNPPCLLLDRPWNNGAVWSMNSSPGLGADSHFQLQWNPKLREQLYGPGLKGDLDGEYVDSAEGYVTDELNFRREHFRAMRTPLTFAAGSNRPAVYRGLIAHDYVRGLAEDVHGMGKLMMANSTPVQLCWLAPMLDVLGTETDWNHEGEWRPMGDADMLYRRALCRGKPFCFLMNTEFGRFPPELVEKYMKRSLAYGMFPGFFSADASTGQYFTRPELYERDRGLFKKYMPLCRAVAEAGWEPRTGAKSSDPRVYVERFGDRGPRYLTVFNDSVERRTVTVTLHEEAPEMSRELVRGGTVAWQGQQANLTLDGEDVAVLQLRP